MLFWIAQFSGETPVEPRFTKPLWGSLEKSCCFLFKVFILNLNPIAVDFNVETFASHDICRELVIGILSTAKAVL